MIARGLYARGCPSFTDHQALNNASPDRRVSPDLFAARQTMGDSSNVLTLRLRGGSPRRGPFTVSVPTTFLALDPKFCLLQQSNSETGMSTTIKTSSSRIPMHYLAGANLCPRCFSHVNSLNSTTTPLNCTTLWPMNFLSSRFYRGEIRGDERSNK